MQNDESGGIPNDWLKSEEALHDFLLLIVKSGGQLDLAKDSENESLTLRQPPTPAKRKMTQLITEPNFPSEDAFVDKFAGVALLHFKSFVERQSSYIFYEEAAGDTWVSCFATGTYNSFVTPTVSSKYPRCPKLLRDAANVLQMYIYFNTGIDPETTDDEFRRSLMSDESGWCATEEEAQMVITAVNRYDGGKFQVRLLRFVEDFKMLFMVRKNVPAENYKTEEEKQARCSTRKSYGRIPLWITCLKSEIFPLNESKPKRPKKKQKIAKTEVGNSTTGRKILS